MVCSSTIPGHNKVGKKLHFIATIIVALGTIISAFWIISANSWMHTPTGYEINADGILVPTSWMKIIFNPSFLYRFAHMLVASYLTTAFVVSGVSAWYLKHKIFVKEAKIMFSMAMLMALFVAPLQLVIGDMSGLKTLEYQPAKIAATEGIWETEHGASLRLFGWPNYKLETTMYALEIPKLSSIILTHSLNGTVKGLKEWPKHERPPTFIIFWSFRIMVALGMLMILTGLTVSMLYFKNKLFHLWCMFMGPSGFIAVLAGWFVTEIGRQPYVVYGVIKTTDAASNIVGKYVFTSLLLFIVVYILIFGAAIYYILQLIKKGPMSITVAKEAN